MDKVRQLTAWLTQALEAESRKHYNSYTPKNHRKCDCSVVDCPNRAFAGGFCNAHYLRRRNGTRMNRPLRCWNRKAVCEACGGPTNSKGGWNLCPRCCKSRRRAVLKAALVEFFGGRCATCAQAFPSRIFDFHHLGNKTGNIGELIDGVSVARLAVEAVKCILLCANCHRLEENHGKF